MATPLLRPGRAPGAQDESRDQLVLSLMQHALTAPDIPSAVSPALDTLVSRTVAAGAAYFQREGQTLILRAGSGKVPNGPLEQAVLTYGLPLRAPFCRALEQSSGPLFISDTQHAPEVVQTADAGVASLAAAPVQHRDGTLIGAFLMYSPKRHLWKRLERDLFGAITSTLAAVVTRLMAEEDAIRALGVAIESRDPEVKGHIERVTELGERVGRELNLDGATLASLRRGAYLHDLGKLATPDIILYKPGRLSEGERRVMQQHAKAGHRVAQQLAFLPREALDVVLYHHERWDGNGYPYGLKGKTIPLTARIFAVCDVYDALTSVRPYKPAWSEEAALDEIRAQAGRHFDPTVVETFSHLFET